jgi:cell division protein FtsW
VLTREPPVALTSARRDEPLRRPARQPARSRGGTFWVLVALVTILCLIGVVMVLSASSIVSLDQFGTPWYFFTRQLMWLAVGSLGFFVTLRVDHRRWRRLATPLMYATIGLLFVVLVPGIGVRTAGASRWLGTSLVQVQPSELAKLALVLFAADVLDRRAARRDWRYQMVPVIAALGLLILLVMAQPDMGTALVLACIAVAMLIIAGIPIKPLGGVLAGGVGAFLLFAVAAPYRWQRMMSFLHPLKDASNTGYQEVQALLALSHGHVLGEGLGASIASYGYLPNAQTDFIFAVIGEETGLLGTLMLSGLFLVLGLVGTSITCRAPSRYSALVAGGITAWLVGQAVINIGAVVGLLPITGVPLPFVSFGGSSLVIAMVGAGMLANVAKQS